MDLALIIADLDYKREEGFIFCKYMTKHASRTFITFYLFLVVERKKKCELESTCPVS